MYGFAENDAINHYDAFGEASSGSATLVLEPTLIMTEEQAARYAARKLIRDAALAAGSYCSVPKDPCKGLRDQYNEHLKKLTDYIQDPDAHDNKEFLKQPIVKERPELRNKIIDGRIKELRKQIENFKRQLDACEKKHGL